MAAEEESEPESDPVGDVATKSGGSKSSKVLTHYVIRYPSSWRNSSRKSERRKLLFPQHTLTMPMIQNRAKVTRLLVQPVQNTAHPTPLRRRARKARRKR